MKISGELILIAATCVWGSTFVVTKDALDSWPPFALLTTRFAMAALFFWPLVLVQRRSFSKADLQHGFLLGIYNILGFALQTVGLRFVSEPRSAFFTAFSTILVPVLTFVLWRKTAAFGTKIAMVLGSAGIVFLFGENAAGGSLVGDLLSLACALVFTAQIVFTTYYAERTEPVVLATIMLSTCTIFAAAGIFLFNERLPALANINHLQMTYLGVVATGLTLLAQMIGQKRTTTHRAGFIFALEPVFATMFAWIFKNRMLTATEWLGASLILVAALLADRSAEQLPLFRSTKKPVES